VRVSHIIIVGHGDISASPHREVNGPHPSTCGGIVIEPSLTQATGKLVGEQS
jgi:hypothetical protein